MQLFPAERPRRVRWGPHYRAGHVVFLTGPDRRAWWLSAASAGGGGRGESQPGSYVSPICPSLPPPPNLSPSPPLLPTPAPIQRHSPRTFPKRTPKSHTRTGPFFFPADGSPCCAAAPPFSSPDHPHARTQRRTHLQASHHVGRRQTDHHAFER